MTITKFGHCCLLIEENGKRILTDPGVFTSQQNEATHIDIVLITHEHADHFHIESVKKVLENNPGVKIITNARVGTFLEKEGIGFTVLEHGGSMEEQGVLLEGFGTDHALFHFTIPPVYNTGYFIANRFFYPGDAFTNPGKAVEILALPVAGPWMKLSEAIDYALEIHPKICFPVHEAIMISPMSTHTIPPQVLEPEGIAFRVLEIGTVVEF